MDEVGRELDLKARARREFEAGRLSREEFIATVAEVDDEIARLQAGQPVAPAPPSIPEHGEDALTREYIAGRISADTYVSAGGDPDVVRDTESRRADEVAARKAAVDKSSNRMMLGCLAIPILLIGGCVALTSMGGGSREDTASDLSYSARSTCEKAIEQQLKDPSSAEYSDVDIAVTDGAAPDFAYEVTGTVRAENSFGGMAVHSFVCNATYTGADEMMRARATLS